MPICRVAKRTIDANDGPALFANTRVDVLRGDLTQARRHGFDEIESREAEFNRYERSWLRRGDIDSSLIADISRAARLHTELPSASPRNHDID